MEKNLYSPTMLKSFLNCKYIIVNESFQKKWNIKKKEKSISDKIRLSEGDKHELAYLKDLKKKFKVLELKKKDLSREDKIKKTIDGMSKGVDIIHGGYLKSGQWVGEFDFLVRKEGLKSKFGKYGYEVIDTKNSSKTKPDHIIQIGMYTYQLENLQRILPEKMHIVLKDKKKESFKINEVYEFFKSTKATYEKFLSNGLKKAYPDKCSFCEICDWQDVCKDKWVKDDHLNQVAGLNKIHIKKFKEAGIKTMTQLAQKKENSSIKDFRPESSKKLISQAKLQFEFLKNKKMNFKFLEENKNKLKGFNLLPKSSNCDLFFDMESVPDYVYPGGLEYLFGIYYEENGKQNSKFFWAHNREEEKKSLVKFFEFTDKHFKKYPDAKIYHYASYEVNALSRLTSLHKVKNIEYDHYLHLEKFVDLFKVVRQGIQISEDSYSLKNIEKFYNFKRTGEVVKAEESEDVYVEWTLSKQQKLLDQIENYNRQDCHSTFELRQWLLSIRPEYSSWYVPSKEEMELREHEIKFIEYDKKINKSKIQTNLKKIVSDILGYYRREAKPEWRLFFDRRNLSHEDLVEDAECIGDLRKIKEPVPEKKSYIYTYKFPEQEYKLREADQATIANELLLDQRSNAGKIVKIDAMERMVQLKRGVKSGTLPDNLSIGPSTPVRSTGLEASTYRYIDSLFDLNYKKYKALNEILSKEIPDIKTIKKGDKITNSDNFLEEIPKTILNLDNSYLFIQGPPGTGKTFQVANAIIELIKKGKKIAVSGNSHKVIHNLLDKIEKIANEKNFSFKGLKKCSVDKEETVYKGEFITSSSNEKDFINALGSDDIKLFAGTKFHLCSNYYDRAVDYLFIDEAGQISLADVISIGTVAKNIILVGDQMQLGQPTKGTHPGESGKSILDYLLEEKDTIPEDKGIFLNKTYRLHPNLNSFISGNFYESRLLVDDVTKNRNIQFPKKYIIQKEGIYFISVNHLDNSQKSVEECQIIKKLYKEFLGLEMTDLNDKKRKIKIDDILTISPYNVQVNYLKSELKKDARIGTIDKFQGQEAPITIISMTSSDSESLPRNKEFFFDRKRLNVAISRAQCVSIIIFNPNLLLTSPKDVNQIRLLNNFFKLLKYKI